MDVYSDVASVRLQPSQQLPHRQLVGRSRLDSRRREDIHSQNGRGRRDGCRRLDGRGHRGGGVAVFTTVAV